MKLYITVIIALAINSFLFAQNIHTKTTHTAPNQYTIVLSKKLTPNEKWFAFSMDSNNAYASHIQVLNGNASIISIDNHNIQTSKDNTLQTDVTYFTDSISATIQLAYTGNDEAIKLEVIPFINNAGNYESKTIEVRAIIEQQSQKNDSLKTLHSGNMSIGLVFLLAFLGGLLAVLTPCVYSMIPITVSFFLKKSVNKKMALKNALYYSLSIIAIFTILGFVITVIFGPQALNVLATNWIANLFFFGIFMIFGISFLGAFEITLPSSWGNTFGNKSNLNNIGGIFFMALTLVIVSFSCTGPIIGNLIVLAAQGSYYGPLVGMFAFSLALVLPFFIFAMMPRLLNKISKSGGWLNVIKVSIGFIELALALKFLSNADLAQGWRLLDREVFIALWVAIFVVWGIYLLGFIRLHHDEALPKNDFGVESLSVTRLLFAIVSLSFAVYLIPGLWGAPLKSASAFLPPMGTQDFILSNAPNNNISNHQNELPAPKKYADKMHIYEPEVVKKFGMVTYFDYQEALQIAKKIHRPIMLDFTGVNCVNCRAMEAKVWSNPEVMQLLKDSFIIASLFVDVHSIDIPISEQYTNKEGQKIITLGDLNTDIQVHQFNANVQPYYFFIDEKGKKLLAEGYGYNENVQEFITHLRKVLKTYNTQNF